jgi:gamma-glutamyltranspeptidase/glutathione hydrolase
MPSSNGGGLTLPQMLNVLERFDLRSLPRQSAASQHLRAEGNTRLLTGTPGGRRITNVILQIIVNTLDHAMNIAATTAAPRMYQGWRSPELFLEPGFSPDIWALLRQRGHRLEPQLTMGSTQSIAIEGRLLHGAADPRRPEASALGVQR